MMRKILYCASALAMAALAWGAETPAPATSTPAKKAATKKKRTVPAKSGASSRTTATRPGSNARTTASRQGKKPAPRTTWRNRQTVPTAERYKEIQDALVAKGYLKPEAAAGAWSESSTDALKRFQADQNLESTGKINSLSLIALGLGPRRDPAPAPPKPPAQ